MQVSAKYRSNTKFEVTARDHKTICDQPRDNGGNDEGMSPPEFLLASLATCAGYYAAQYLTTRHLPADALDVNVTAEKATQPARLAFFRIDVNVPDLEGRHQSGILRAVKTCLIHNTLLGAPALEVSVNGLVDSAHSGFSIPAQTEPALPQAAPAGR